MTTQARTISRREILKGGTAVAAVALAGAPGINLGYYTLFEGTPHAEKFSGRAIRLMEEATVIDMLCPLSIHSKRTDELLNDPATFTSSDYEFYRASGINLFHDTTGGDGLAMGRDDYERAILWAASWNGFLASHPEWFLRVTTPAHLDQLNDSGKIGFLMGLQDSTHFRSVDDVNVFHSLGQKLSQLTYNSQNLIGTGSMDRNDSGISDFGVEIVQRMNEVGMTVDVGHCGDQTTLDAFEISTKPVLITHSNVRALNPGYPRNKTDEAIVKMARSGGVIGMTAVRSFVRNEEPTTIEHLLDHYDHVAKLVGVEHLGIGSDTGLLGGYDVYDKETWNQIGGRYRAEYAFRDKIDMDEMPTQKRTFLLTEGLIRRGYSDSDIRLILGDNFKRVLKETWTV